MLLNKEITYKVVALYKFVKLENYVDLQKPLHEVMTANDVKGTLLLAEEGINGTIAGPEQGVDAVVDWLGNDERFNNLSLKASYTEIAPFNRTKVKLKKEIVTMGVEGIDPQRIVGTYVKPEDWNALIADPEVLVIDTRNDYEYQVGSFVNAINPKTESFREFPKYVSDNLDPAKHKKVAMFCTGGIRCEKSTAYLKEQGFDEVFHLEGGILKYLEEVPADNSLWQGECFVFDERVTVNHQLEKGDYDQCHACRLPITNEDKHSPLYVKGVSCPHCHDKVSDEQRARFAEREKQVQLARARGEQHVGSDAAQVLKDRRRRKQALREQSRAAQSPQQKQK